MFVYREKSAYLRYLETLNDHNDVYIQNHHIQPPMEYTLGICLKYVFVQSRTIFLWKVTLFYDLLHSCFAFD